MTLAMAEPGLRQDRRRRRRPAHEIEGVGGDRIGRIVYSGDRPKRWLGERDVWLHGYWFWDWAEQRQKVQSIDAAKRIIALAPPHHVYGYRKGQWYYALNLLPELDSPGEWYLERPSGVLYFWPPAPLAEGKTFVSVAASLLSLNEVSHVTFRGLTFEGAARRRFAPPGPPTSTSSAARFATSAAGPQTSPGATAACRAATFAGPAMAAWPSTAATDVADPGPHGGRQQPHPPLFPLEPHVSPGQFLTAWGIGRPTISSTTPRTRQCPFPATTTSSS